tara:strand:+ start:1266 stop:1391 length:126 start_codon:yes stop_codon:yes gene_type:complete
MHTSLGCQTENEIIFVKQKKNKNKSEKRVAQNQICGKLLAC